MDYKQLANQYHVKWQQNCARNPRAMVMEYDNWERGDRVLEDMLSGKRLINYTEMEQYANYVTKQLCIESTAIIIELANDILSSVDVPMTACTIGNIVYVYKTIREMRSVPADLELRLYSHLDTIFENNKKYRS